MAKDKIHYAVKIALENDGWQVTDDPLVLFFDDDSVAIDLGAEKLIIAEKGTEKIAIEIKAFNQPSVIYEFHRAIGQYFNYQTALLEAHENRKLYVAIPDSILQKLMDTLVIRKSIERMQMKFIVVNIETQRVTQWIE